MAITSEAQLRRAEAEVARLEKIVKAMTYEERRLPENRELVARYWSGCEEIVVFDWGPGRVFVP